MDNEVFVEELLEIPNYRFVSLSMHGSLGCDGEGNVCPIIILLDDKASSKRDNELKRYLAKYEIAKMYIRKGANVVSFVYTVRCILCSIPQIVFRSFFKW